MPLTLAAVIGQAGTALLLTYALGRDVAQHGNSFLVTDLLLVVLFVGAVRVIVFVWRGIAATIRDFRAYKALPIEQLHALAIPPRVRLPT